MSDESAPKGALDDLGQEVKDQLTEEDPHGPAIWAKVPRYIATMTLPKDALRVFIVLSSYADGRERLAWPSQDTIARDLGWISKSTGRPDRSRISTAIGALLEADVVRKAGRHRHGVRAWTTRYLVAPFPGEGLYEPSNTSAGGVVRNPGERLYETARGVVSGHAQINLVSDQPSDQKSEEPAMKKKHEEPEPESVRSLASFNHDQRPRWRRATQSEEARDEPA
jgi:hypothetical protein